MKHGGTYGPRSLQAAYRLTITQHRKRSGSRRTRAVRVGPQAARFPLQGGESRDETEGRDDESENRDEEDEGGGEGRAESEDHREAEVRRQGEGGRAGEGRIHRAAGP
ncbi:hypothetical protein [Streptomyces sp. NPDC002265]|uniref:hypothetical protein n=1 Tax=Streptomyces sp. NPDC002265 TaxID=3154415 RepID=UPI00332F8688